MLKKRSTGNKPGHNSSDHGFITTPKAIPTAPTPQRNIIRSSGIVSAHPSMANRNESTVPWPQRYAILGEASRELKLAKDALTVARSKYGVDGVAPGVCAGCLHQHRTEPLTKGLCDASITDYTGAPDGCPCYKSTPANEAQSAMYVAEKRVKTAEVKVEEATKQVAEPQPRDSYYVVRGLRSRNQIGWVVLTKSEGDRIKVLLEFKDVNGNPTSQRWFYLNQLERSLIHNGLV